LVVEKGVRGEYDNIAAMLAELTDPDAAQATFLRPLRQSYGVATHPGRAKRNNQDSVVVFNFVREPGNAPVGLYVVADGMGGHKAGGVASATINRIVTHRLLQQNMIETLTDDTGNLTKSPGTILSKAIQEANQAIWEMNGEQGSNMGAVVVAVLLINDKAVIADVGDSRVYLLRDTELTQMTKDHSVVARLLETGAIESDQARTHPSRNQVYRSLGEKNIIEIDVHTQPLQSGDRLLLCCDGLWDMLPNQDILRIVVRASSLQSACDDLVQAANAAGGEDNISVILVQME
jgi:protein phosphatase